ncbi:MAG: leucine-rich repeat protein [Lachnospiraceae bacterium]|nr:leucine-rich repeat protein [Lachnospiraceae bacterium]
MPDYTNWNKPGWLDNDNAKAATKLEIASGITSIGNYAFYGLNITSADIPDTVISIGEYAFQNCNKLTTISPLTSVSSIGRNAFYRCTSLSSVKKGDSLTTIGNYAFFSCSSLSSLELGNSLTTIGDYAFSGCSSLPSVLITSNSIGTRAFQNCSGLSRVYFTDRINTIGDYAFSNSGVKDVYYKGSQNQWNTISGHDQSPLNSANKKYNFDPSKVSSVTLDEFSFYLGKGNTGTLTAVIFPETATDKTVTWEVDHNTIVKITDAEDTEDGSRATLTGLENGTATVTVRTTDGNKTAECEIEVGTPVKKIAFSDGGFDLGVGKTRQLQWTIEPEDAGNKDVTFKSDDESIASVDTEGLVTAKAKGKTNITVTTRDGEKRATCEVNVVENVEVTNLYLDKENVLLAPGESEELTVEVVPENATDKEVAWSVERSSIAKVEDQGNGKATVTAVAEGTTTLTVKTKNSGSYYAPSAQCTITVWKGSICLTRYGSPAESVTLGINES